MGRGRRSRGRGGGVAGFWVIDTGPGNAVARPEKVTRDADGAFRPSDTQWASLRLAPVRQVAFRDERATDGKIAINEDTTTPVFSPYSGRVSRLIARPGDLVERGAPLFAIEASEFVQGQNDLVTAVAGVEKARSRLALAQTAEKRQRELLAIRGGALKDLEQAQSDLVGAQGDLRSAEIALAAVRNRLRILGRSDEEIAQAREAVDRIGAEADRRRADRRHDHPAQDRPRPVHQCRRQRPGLHGRQSLDGVADRQCARIGRAQDEGGRRRSRSRCWPIPGRVFNARLAYVAPALDPNTRRLPVRAEIQNPGRELLPEMFASFRIVSGDEPADAGGAGRTPIVYEGAKARVWVARPDSKTVVSRADRGRRHDQRPGRGAQGPRRSARPW